MFWNIWKMYVAKRVVRKKELLKAVREKLLKETEL